jgi:hypothetical protein
MNYEQLNAWTTDELYYAVCDAVKRKRICAELRQGRCTDGLAEFILCGYFCADIPCTNAIAGDSIGA